MQDAYEHTVLNGRTGLLAAHVARLDLAWQSAQLVSGIRYTSDQVEEQRLEEEKGE